MTKVKPEIFSGPLGWGWASLKELAEIIGQSPKEIWTSFFSLSKDVDLLAISPDLNRVWNVDEEGYLAYSFGEYGEDKYAFGSPKAFRKALKAGNLYVPAGWAQDVLRAHELGAVRVEMVSHEHLSHLDGCPDGALSCYFTGYDFVSAVGLDAEGNPVPYCERPAPRTESGCCHGCLGAGEILPGHSICVWPSEEGLRALEEGKARLLLDRNSGWQLIYDEDC